MVRDDRFDGSDSRGISHILMCAAKKIEEDTGKKFDLIFCGKEATDAALGQVGAELSELLGTGVITNVIGVEFEEGQVCAKQETEEGYRLIETASPCVLTVTKPDYDPRYPTIKIRWQPGKCRSVRSRQKICLCWNSKNRGGRGLCKKLLNCMNRRKRGPESRCQEETAQDSAFKAVAMMADAKVF